MTLTSDWIKKATIYEIYPLTFRCDKARKDQGDDRYGTLAGITEKLDYIQRLNCDTIWLAPFYSSPLKDGFGYNVDDHTKISPVLGTDEDFDRLIDQAHRKGLRVIIDLVFAHTSASHSYFQESAKSRIGSYADYYVWADPVFAKNGERRPPSNWMSMDPMADSAWEWTEQRQQNYLHWFNKSMPCLNIHNRKVQTSLLEVAAFWLERHVDGFRIDAPQHIGFDPTLRDVTTWDPSKGYNGQDTSTLAGRPEAIEFLKKLRQLTKMYELTQIPNDSSERKAPGIVAECFASQQFTKELLKHCVDVVFDGALTGNLSNFKRIVYEDCARLPPGTIAWAMSGHDVPRVVDRCFGSGRRAEYSVLFAGMLASLPGPIILFQGEELGLYQGKINDALNSDPLGLAGSFMTESDACRAGMPWADGVNSNLWLKPQPSNTPLAPEIQERNTCSTFHRVSQILKLRREMPCLRSETPPMFLESSDPSLLALIRHDEGIARRQVLCLFNFDQSAKEVTLKANGEEIFSCCVAPLHAEFTEVIADLTARLTLQCKSEKTPLVIFEDMPVDLSTMASYAPRCQPSHQDSTRMYSSMHA